MPRGLGVPAAPVNTDLTGDEAYQRRLAITSGSQQQQPTSTVAPVDRIMSGDDAYARRMAMSSGQAPFEKEDTGDGAYQRRAALSSMSQVHQQELLRESPPSLAYNPFAPVSVPPPPPGPPPSIEDEVARKREAAAAIAAKFGALAAMQHPEDSNTALHNAIQQCVLYAFATQPF